MSFYVPGFRGKSGLGQPVHHDNLSSLVLALVVLKELARDVSIASIRHLFEAVVEGQIFGHIYTTSVGDPAVITFIQPVQIGLLQQQVRVHSRLLYYFF